MNHSLDDRVEFDDETKTVTVFAREWDNGEDFPLPRPSVTVKHLSCGPNHKFEYIEVGYEEWQIYSRIVTRAFVECGRRWGKK